MSPELRRKGLALGALTLLGGLGIDMYLPAMPGMARALHASSATTQLSLTTYLLAMAIGQLVYGPLSDRIGRRPPMLAGLILFSLASLGCALARTIELLILMRFIQGLGASAIMVLAQATVRDLCSGPTAVRMLSTMMAVVGVAPIVSPVIGGFVVQSFSWRSLFGGLALLALAGIAVPLAALPETRPRTTREGARDGALSALRRLIEDRRFMGLALIPALTQASTFAFVASSAAIFVDLLRLSPLSYSLVFAFNALALIGGAQLSGRAVDRLGAPAVIRRGVLATACGALVLLAMALAGPASLPLTMLAFFLTFASVGFIGSPAIVEALAPHAPIAGTAAALAGTLQMGFGAIGSGLASALADGTATPLALVMTGATLLALLVVQLTFGRASLPTAPRS